MRRNWMGAVVVAGLLISFAQIPVAMGQGRGGGQGGFGGGGGRGGFGGGQMGQRVQGTVTAVAGNKVAIQTSTGDSYDITSADNARIMKSGEQIKLSDIKPGDSLTVMGQVDATKKTIQAMMISDVDAATVAKAAANLGKTYIIGRITAIDGDNLKLMVMRGDNVSQAIAVDDGTSFQRGNSGVQADVVAAGAIPSAFGGRGGGMGGRGGNAQAAPPPESITLADIRVGDTVMATGTVKNGTFTVLKMGVSTPGAGQGAGGARGRGAQGSQGMAPAEAAPQPSVVPQ